MFDIGSVSGQLDLIERRRVPRRLVRGQAMLLCRDDNDVMVCLIRDQSRKVLASRSSVGHLFSQRLARREGRLGGIRGHAYAV